MYKNNLAGILSTTQYLLSTSFRLVRCTQDMHKKSSVLMKKRAVIADTQINLVSGLHHGFFLSSLSPKKPVSEWLVLGTIQTMAGNKLGHLAEQ